MRKIAFAIPLLLPASAIALPMWLDPLVTTDCVESRMTEVLPDGSHQEMTFDNRKNFRWLRCTLHHRETRCTTWIAQTDWSGFDDLTRRNTVARYVVKLGDWNCPSGVSPPRIYNTFTAEVELIALNIRKPRSQEPITVMLRRMPETNGTP